MECSQEVEVTESTSGYDSLYLCDHKIHKRYKNYNPWLRQAGTLRFKSGPIVLKAMGIQVKVLLDVTFRPAQVYHHRVLNIST